MQGGAVLMAEFLSEVESGDRRRALVALRDKLAATMNGSDVPARDLAALANRLQSVVAELDGLPAERKGTAVDEVARKRAARKAGADVLSTADGGVQRG